MLRISADFLSLSGEPAVLVKQGKIVFANSAAEAVIGRNCIGRTPSAIFGAELAGSPAAAFVCDVMLNGVCYIARVTAADNMRVIFFSRRELPAALLNDAFVYSIRNRLMSFSVASDIARQHAESLGNEEMLSCIASMTQEYFRARRNVENVCIIRCVSNNTIFPTSVRFDLREMLDCLIELLRTMVSDVSISLAPGAPLNVAADPTLIQQLVLNLISNAVLHAHGRTHINLSLHETGSHAVISVSDNGCGIPVDKLHHVFERYCQSFDMSNVGAGAGFGLTVAQSIAQLHGGTILLESREGIGTTVRASLSLNCPFAEFHTLAEDTWSPAISPVLIGLSDCLDKKYFSEKFLD